MSYAYYSDEPEKEDSDMNFIEMMANIRNALHQMPITFQKTWAAQVKNNQKATSDIVKQFAPYTKKRRRRQRRLQWSDVVT